MRARWFFAVGIALCVLASGASAAIMDGKTIQQGDYLQFIGSPGWGDQTADPGITDLYGKGSGGEFQFNVYRKTDDGPFNTVNDLTLMGQFVTFCAEGPGTNQFIYQNAYYKIESKSNSNNSVGDWIYHGYVTGGTVVPSRVFGTYGNDEAGKIQDALWQSSGLAPSGWISAAEYSQWVTAAGLDNPNTWTTTPKIAFLTPVDYYLNEGTSGSAQNQWIYVQGPGGGDVPEPASLLIWSALGLGGLAVWSRRRRNGMLEGAAPGWSRENRDAICALIERGRKA